MFNPNAAAEGGAAPAAATSPEPAESPAGAGIPGMPNMGGGFDNIFQSYLYLKKL